jgi:hypothetical protein
VRSLVYYITGHGFGHAVRSAEIIRGLQSRRPELPIHVCTTAPDWLFPPLAGQRRVALDVGVIQADALQTDYDETLRQLGDLVAHADEIIAREATYLRGVNAGLVVADIPPTAFMAAQAAGVPSVGVANFSWDWIYEPYLQSRSDGQPLYEWLRASYSAADVLQRLPLHGDLSTFRTIEDVPLVTRRPSAAKPELRARLGLQPDERAVLLGFGGLGLSGLDSTRLAELPECRFVITDKELQTQAPLPPNVLLAPVRQDNYTDLMAACDIVITKPGYGMVASCLAEQLPLLYTDRHDFREYNVLVQAIEQYGRGVHIPQTDLLSANFGPYLQRLDSLTPSSSTPLETNGAEIVAERLLGLIGS